MYFQTTVSHRFDWTMRKHNEKGPQQSINFFSILKPHSVIAIKPSRKQQQVFLCKG